jgi:hypothetical protein
VTVTVTRARLRRPGPLPESPHHVNRERDTDSNPLGSGSAAHVAVTVLGPHRLGEIRQVTAHVIRGTAELALRYFIISAFAAGPKHYSVMTTGLQWLLECGLRRWPVQRLPASPVS